MNKQGPGKIDYCDFSLNIISGRCLHNCAYCYMKRSWNRFKKMAELKINMPKKPLPKKTAVIFIGSSTDMWGAWVPFEWVERVIQLTHNNPHHTFLFLTKNPQRYRSFDDDFPDNVWLGTTVDGSPFTKSNLMILASHPHKNKWVSFEPLKNDLENYEYISEMKWVVIGADSTRGVDKPDIEWGNRLIQFANVGLNLPVWVKDNWPELPRLKKTPWNCTPGI